MTIRTVFLWVYSVQRFNPNALRGLAHKTRKEKKSGCGVTVSFKDAQSLQMLRDTHNWKVTSVGTTLALPVHFYPTTTTTAQSANIQETERKRKERKQKT